MGWGDRKVFLTSEERFGMLQFEYMRYFMSLVNFESAFDITCCDNSCEIVDVLYGPNKGTRIKHPHCSEMISVV